jgi:hypothetical protein
LKESTKDAFQNRFKEYVRCQIQYLTHLRTHRNYVRILIKILRESRYAVGGIHCHYSICQQITAYTFSLPVEKESRSIVSPYEGCTHHFFVLALSLLIKVASPPFVPALRLSQISIIHLVIGAVEMAQPKS